VVATDANGCEVEAAVFNVVAGMQSTVDRGPLTIFPNPVEDELVVRGSEFEGTAPQGVLRTIEISIYNVIGEKVFVAVDCQLPTVDCRLLLQGLYFLEIKTADKAFRVKFIKSDFE